MRKRASAAKSSWLQDRLDWLKVRRHWMTVAGVVLALILLLVLGTFAYALATLPIRADWTWRPAMSRSTIATAS